VCVFPCVLVNQSLLQSETLSENLRVFAISVWLEMGQRISFLKISLYFADFALELLDYFFSFQRLKFQRVKPARRAKLQLHNLFQSLDGTVVCVLAYRDESVDINNFSRHSFFTPV